MVQSAITDLRKFQWGMQADYATGSVTMDTQPTAGDTLTIGDQVYTFRDAVDVDVAGEVSRGTNIATAQAALVDAINNGVTVGGVLLTPRNAKARVTAFVADVMPVIARQGGVAGNSVGLAETFTAGTNIVSGANLAGGAVDADDAVPATSVIITNNIDIEPNGQVYHPELLRGLIQRYKGGEIVTQRGIKWTMPDTLAIYEQLPNWASYGIKGKVAATGTGPYVFTFERDPTADPDIDAFTLERQMKAFGGVVDEEYPYCFVSRITWKGGQNQPVMVNIEGFGRDRQDSTFTPSLEAPPFVGLLASSSKLYIEDDWASLASPTQVEGQVVSWEVGFMTGYMPLYLADGNANLDWTRPVISSENTQIYAKVTLLVAPSAQYEIEQAAAKNQTLRALRIETNGPDGRQAYWDAIVKHENSDLTKIGSFEGQEMVEMSFVESTDDDSVSSAHLFRHVITLPAPFGAVQ